MWWLIGSVNLVALLATLLGRPAPTEIGPVEIGLALAAGLAVAVSVATRPRSGGRAPTAGRFGLLIACLIVWPVLLSLVVGAVRGVPVSASLRATAPYVAFVGFGFMGQRQSARRHARSIVAAILVAGLLHATYLVGLFVATTPLTAEAATIRLARITLLDPRTTVPLAMAASILPWPMLLDVRHWSARVLLAAIGAVAAVGVVATQTRSMILAGAVGVTGSTVVAGLWRTLASSRSPAVAIRRVTVGILLLMASGAAVFAVTPPLRELAMSVLLRNRLEGDTGRVEDEWKPVVSALADEGTAAAVFGVGGGQSFVTGSGQERTYIHNLVLYGLFYSGVAGASMWILAYGLLVIGLVRRGWRDNAPAMFGLAGVVLGLFVYGQFFAVHKLLSYNLLLMLCLQALTAGAERAAE